MANEHDGPCTGGSAHRTRSLRHGGGPATRAALSEPHSIQFDAKGDLYIADIRNHRIRRIDMRSGVISTFAGTGERSATPDGAPRGNHSLDVQMLTQRAGALVGRIGHSPPFFVGSNGLVVASTVGRLYLGVNDDDFRDNIGAFEVTITIQ